MIEISLESLLVYDAKITASRAKRSIKQTALHDALKELAEKLDNYAMSKLKKE